jgi:hypothetical protein
MTEVQKQLSDYGITPEQAEYFKLLDKHWDAIEDFRNKYIADPENCGDPPTEKQIKAEIQRLKANENNQALHIPGKMTTIATDSGHEDDMDVEFYRLLAKHKGAINNFTNKFTNQNSKIPSVTDINAELQRLEGLEKVKNTGNKFYGTSSIKRERRTKDEIEHISQGLIDLLNESHPQTVRQVFYQMTSRGYVPKTEHAYRGTICRLLTELRLSHKIPFGYIADNTRWMRKPDTYDGVDEVLASTVRAYRRALWTWMPHYVEVWIEKDALAGVVNEVTSKWDVPLMVTRGYASLSYLYDAAQVYESKNKPVYVYYMGDYDPSGMDITNSVEKRMREFAPNSEIHFQRIAVTPQQIRDLDLPTRPTKQTDTRSRNFESNVSVELDAIPADMLTNLVDYFIRQHIDADEYYELQRIETLERESFEWVAHNMSFKGGHIGITKEFREKINESIN